MTDMGMKEKQEEVLREKINRFKNKNEKQKK